MGEKPRRRHQKERRAAALRYRDGVDAAPKVVASGRGDLAERIVAAAREHGVPLREDTALVEMLCCVRPGEMIPEAAYRAVAEILALLWALDRKAGA